MPDWKTALTEIAKSIETAARESRTTPRGRESAFRQNYRPNQCLFWECNVPIRAEHVFCYDHFLDLQEGLIDECPGCMQAKDVQYDVCLKCYRNPPPHPARTRSAGSKSGNSWYKPEYSRDWEKGDAATSQFFIYILKLNGGKFYAGQTRELRERLSEHKDGRVPSTARQNPKLVWFGTLPSREAATTAEVELKKLIDANPREVRRMVLRFKDLVQELDYTQD